jgi:hypothetical protein
VRPQTIPMAIACLLSRARAARYPTAPPGGAAARRRHAHPPGARREAGKPAVSIRRVHVEPAIERGVLVSTAGEIAWLALWPDRTFSYHVNADALVRAALRRDQRDAARAERLGRGTLLVGHRHHLERHPTGVRSAQGEQLMETQMIEIRGDRVPLTAGSHIRGWFVYQGGDYFEFRQDGADRWQLSQSSEWDYHDPSHVVGQGPTLQAAAEDFARSITRRIERRPNTPRATSGCDLVGASVDLLIAVVGQATRLGYDDGRAGAATRRGNGVADALGLVRWTRAQQLQLRHAYVIGRQHAVSERKRRGEAARSAIRPSRAPIVGRARR